jgi:Family of unknown function (DUF6283)
MMLPCSDKVRPESCTACPYRRDVPSGVWAASEYDKLAAYDGPTWSQPPGRFHCHATPEVICHGWAVVHSRQEGESELMALRIFPVEGDIPPEGAPLFSSGAEAAEHGKRDIDHPSAEAQEVAARLMRKYSRLRTDA